MREDEEVDISSYWIICRKRECNGNSKRRLQQCALENQVWTRIHTCRRTDKATTILSLHTIFHLVFRSRKLQRPTRLITQFRITFKYLSLQLGSRNKKYPYVFSKKSSNVLIIHQTTKYFNFRSQLLFKITQSLNRRKLHLLLRNSKLHQTTQRQLVHV